MGRVRKFLVLLLSTTSVLAICCGICFAVRSPLFLVQVVEVVDQPENAPPENVPVNAQKITELAAVPVGQVNLFELDLKAVERRILSNPWVRDVRLQKRFPQTLSISVTYREPKALIQIGSGTVGYLDAEGNVFGEVNLQTRPDLPVLSGVDQEPERKIPGKIQEALRLVSEWQKSPVSRTSEISSLHWDPERGFRLLVSYRLAATGETGGFGRTMVDLGQEIDGSLETRLQRLHYVIRYLSKNSIIARQIWADAGKKIVVKTAHGS